MKYLITGGSGGLGKVIINDIFSYKSTASVTNLSLNGSLKLKEFENKNFNSFNVDLSKVSSKKDFELIKNPQEYNHLILCHGKNYNLPITEINEEILLESFKVNYFSNLYLTQYFLDNWGSSKSDRSITYISSVATKGGSPSEVPYHSAKRAMESFMLSVAREYSSKGIRANVVSPGLMDTEMGKETLKNRPDVLDRVPLKKLTSKREVSFLINFLTKSQTITGQNIHINAGRHFTL